MANNKELLIIKEDFINKLKRNFEEFSCELEERTTNINNFITINEIEKKLGETLDKNSNDYLSYINNFLNSVDEKKLIEFQKKNSQQKAYY